MIYTAFSTPIIITVKMKAKITVSTNRTNENATGTHSANRTIRITTRKIKLTTERKPEPKLCSAFNITSPYLSL